MVYHEINLVIETFVAIVSFCCVNLRSPSNNKLNSGTKANGTKKYIFNIKIISTEISIFTYLRFNLIFYLVYSSHYRLHNLI